MTLDLQKCYMSSQIFNNDKLAEVFDVDVSENTALVPQEITTGELVVSPNGEREAEFQYVKTNLHGLITKGTDAIANALQVAAESQHPRAYEVAGNLIKNIADLTDKLVALEKVKAQLDPVDNPKNVNIDKAVFVGSTAELLKMIKNESSN